MPLPESTAFVEGACLGVPASTAHFAVLADGPLVGQTVLVQGGAGAVGDYAVQWAKRAGAHVIATVGSDAKAELARASGADTTVNRRTEDVVQRVLDLTDGQGVDRIVEVDFGANLDQDVSPDQTQRRDRELLLDRAPGAVFPYYPLGLQGGDAAPRPGVHPARAGAGVGACRHRRRAARWRAAAPHRRRLSAGRRRPRTSCRRAARPPAMSSSRSPDGTKKTCPALPGPRLATPRSSVAALTCGDHGRPSCFRRRLRGKYRVVRACPV